MKTPWIIALCVIVLATIYALIKRSKKANHNKENVSEEKLGEIIASLAFLRSDDFIDKEISTQTDIPFMLPEKIQYYSDLMYTCMMINSMGTLPESVDLDEVATSAVIHIQANHLLYLTYISHKNDIDVAEQIISDYHDMFDRVYDALQAKSPFILGGVYRDCVIQDTDLFNKLNENLKVTTMVSNWLNDASMVMKRYTIS